MKLLSKYNRINIPVLIGSVIFISIIYYFILHFVLLHQLDNDLAIEEQEIMDYVRQKGSLPAASTYSDQQILFNPVTANVPERKFATERIYDNTKKNNELFRQLTFPIRVNNSLYVATVRKSQQQTEDLIKIIVMITLIVVALLIIVLFVMNRFILAKLWRPFNDTLQQLKQFNISTRNKLQLNKTDINEFAELNKTASLMTEKVSNDYDSLKSFTENASHEIQTPLAIIKMKVELLMQNENMDDAWVENITAISDATDRLSRLNQSLLLLTKIDNSQFIENERVNISKITGHCISNFEELAASKKIHVKKRITHDVILVMNKALAEILISNIMTNTLKHNYENGEINVDLNDTSLSVSNTGKEPSTETNELFERFKKDTSSSDSLGLGLAIVKKICEAYGFNIHYSYSSPKHTINIHFAPST